MLLSRRDILAAGAFSLASTLTRDGVTSATENDTDTSKTGLPIGFSTYGLPGQSLENAVELAQRVGYDALEVCVMKGREQFDDQLSHNRRRAIRRVLRDHDIELPSLMENLQPLQSAEQHRADLDQLKRTCNLAHDFNPNSPPIIQTVVGGKDWEGQKGLLRDRLSDWIDIANSHEVTIAIKPHRGHAMSRPTHALWLKEQLGNPANLKMCFDYSHFVLRDMSIESSVKDSLPMLAGVAVKDAKLVDGRVRFALPGESDTIDYKKLLSCLYNSGYRDPICVEVSSQVWRQPDYDPVGAMEQSYVAISDAMTRARIPKRHQASGWG